MQYPFTSRPTFCREDVPSRASARSIGGTGLRQKRYNSGLDIRDFAAHLRRPDTAGNWVRHGSGPPRWANTYSDPVGNGSSHSWSSNVWSKNDYYQFEVNTAGLSGISLSWDQTTSAANGPISYSLEYSTNGSSFATFATYNVLVNGASPNAAWNSTTWNPAYSFGDNLSSVGAINNQSTVFFRLINNTNVPVVAPTDSVDNFTVTAIPEPSIYVALIGASALAFATIRRRRMVA